MQRRRHCCRTSQTPLRRKSQGCKSRSSELGNEFRRRDLRSPLRTSSPEVEPKRRTYRSFVSIADAPIVTPQSLPADRRPLCMQVPPGPSPPQPTGAKKIKTGGGRSWTLSITTLPYARDRAVECYFWALGVYFEVKYSKARLMLAKIITMASILDDTYDSFGKPDELEIFTDAIQKWDIRQMDRLPHFMKIIYKTLIDLFEKYDKELSEEGRSFAVHYTKERVKELVRSYNIEVKWSTERCIPPVAEYLKNGLPSSTLYLLITASFLGIKSVTREAFEWSSQNPRIIEANALLGRVINDIASYEREKCNRINATGIDYYMNDYGVTAEEAMDKFQEMVVNAWKDTNEDILQPIPSAVSTEILICILNFARIDDVVYKNKQDGYTNLEKALKPSIFSLFVNSFEI